MTNENKNLKELYERTSRARGILERIDDEHDLLEYFILNNRGKMIVNPLFFEGGDVSLEFVTRFGGFVNPKAFSNKREYMEAVLYRHLRRYYDALVKEIAHYN